MKLLIVLVITFNIIQTNSKGIGYRQILTQALMSTEDDWFQDTSVSKRIIESYEKPVSTSKRESKESLLEQLRAARQDYRNQIRLCGIKHNFTPLGNCKACLDNCQAPCRSCGWICSKDKGELQSKGCNIDRNRILGLKRKLAEL